MKQYGNYDCSRFKADQVRTNLCHTTKRQLYMTLTDTISYGMEIANNDGRSETITLYGRKYGS
jgi:hypothetical protein